MTLGDRTHDHRSSRSTKRSTKKVRPLPSFSDGPVNVHRYLFRGYVILVAFHRFTGLCLNGLWMEEGLFDDAMECEGENVMGKFTEKAKQAAAKKVGPQAAKDADFAKDYPALHEYLTEVLTSAGELRQTASLSIFTQDGCFKAYLNDKETGMSLAAAGDSFTGLLEALEAMLQSPATPWRVQKDRPDFKKGKKTT